MSENFGYDSLNRLASSQVAGQAAKFYGYDALGNLTSQGGLSYSYPLSGAGGVRPHAAGSITGSVVGLSNPAFNYDANGNLAEGLGRRYGWTSFNQAGTIDKLSGTTATQRTAFIFDPEHQRVRQTVSPMSAGVPGAATRTVYYGPGIEKEIDSTANTTTIRTYLPGGLGYLEEKLSGTAVDATASATAAERYFLNDRLRSPLAIVDASRTVLQRLSHDPWGRRRNTDGSDDTSATLGSIVNGQDHTGYTGHEQLDQLALVHMNGRIYDPITARMLSADPTVPDSSDTQSLNRYSYVLNNPFAYVDPSGYAGADVEDRHVEDSATAQAAGNPVQALPRVVITGTPRMATPMAGVGVLSMSISGGGFTTMPGVPNMGGGPWIALGAAPGTPAQQSFARLVYKISSELESAAHGAKVLASLIWAAVSGDQENAEDADAALGSAGNGKGANSAGGNTGSAGGKRAGKAFTPNGKAEIDAENADRNGGENVCENCGQQVVPGQKSEPGVTPPGNERQRDHIIPKSKGGNGDASNGQILCRTCNLTKSDK